MKEKVLSFLVITLRKLERCLDRVFLQNVQAVEFVVICVDDKSTDGTIATV